MRALPAGAAQTLTFTMPSMFESPYLVAWQKGYFAEEGLDFKYTLANGGVATPALLSGSIDASASSASALAAIMRGGAMRIILVLQNRGLYSLWSTRPDIRTLADVKGKQIGMLLKLLPSSNRRDRVGRLRRVHLRLEPRSRRHERRHPRRPRRPRPCSSTCRARRSPPIDAIYNFAPPPRRRSRSPRQSLETHAITVSPRRQARGDDQCLIGAPPSWLAGKKSSLSRSQPTMRTAFESRPCWSPAEKS